MPETNPSPADFAEVVARIRETIQHEASVQVEP